MALVVARLLPALPIACSEPKICGWTGFRGCLIAETILKRASSWNPTISAVILVESPLLGRCGVGATAGLHSVGVVSRSSMIEIPVTCYQLIGLHNQSEKDEIVKAVMQLKNSDVEEGYTIDALVSRQELLLDVRDKLLFENEYAGDVRRKIQPKEPLQIPLPWLSGALCLLQEVGETSLVLDFGRKMLQNTDAKPFTHDLILSMVLAECAVAKICFENDRVFLGYEALAHAQILLRKQASLGKMALLAEIEDSLEALAPACTLEILGLPRSSENRERRRRAMEALRELLRQGLDVETSCPVRDWPNFMSQALHRLMAREIVDLLPWDSLALARRNKNLFESQNQRAVIDVDCFYTAFLAHVALGFSCKQMEMIGKAKTICHCLIASDAADMKFEEVLCSFFLREISEIDTMEKLQQLNIISNSTSMHSSEKSVDPCALNQLVEKWLKDVALELFSDTRDCLPSLDNFFNVQIGSLKSRHSRGSTHIRSTVNHQELCNSNTPSYRDAKKPLSHASASDHLGPLVAPQTSSSPISSISVDRTSGIFGDSPSLLQLGSYLGPHHNDAWKMWTNSLGLVKKLAFVMFLAMAGFSAFKLYGMKFMRSGSCCNPDVVTSFFSHPPGSSVNRDARAVVFRRNDISGRINNLFAMARGLFRSSRINESFQSIKAEALEPAVVKRPMALEEAKALVKQWQSIKAEALGPDYQTNRFHEILDEAMLVQWQSLADAAKSRSFFWRFVLLQLSILHANISLNPDGKESAEIHALLEEVAELVGVSQHKNPNYYSTYKIHYYLKRQDDGAWVFCNSNIIS